MSIKKVQNPTQGLKTAKKLLYKHVDQKTALFLSGGSTPKLLYRDIAIEKKLTPGAVALVDERYGLPLHPNSNEEMIKDTGLLSYLSSINIPFYEILQQVHRHSGLSRISLNHGDSGCATLTRMTLGKATSNYEKDIRHLFSIFPKKIAIMGIGEDGHIAGLPAKVKSQKLKVKSYVTEFSDFPGEFRERITLTFNALSKMDLSLVLVFGSGKQNALNLMFTQGSEEEVPARFFRRPDIAKKTLLITDQKVYNNY